MFGNILKHVDYDWVCEKAGKHGFMVHYHNPYGWLKVSWITSWSKYEVFCINLELLFRASKRWTGCVINKIRRVLEV